MKIFARCARRQIFIQILENPQLPQVARNSGPLPAQHLEEARCHVGRCLLVDAVAMARPKAVLAARDRAGEARQPRAMGCRGARTGERRGERARSTKRVFSALQAALAMKRLGPSTCFPLTVPAPADPTPCPVFAALTLPVSSSSFTAPDVHSSRSWRRHAREFVVKPLSFRLKPQPAGSVVATLMGGDLFTFAGKWHNQ